MEVPSGIGQSGGLDGAKFLYDIGGKNEKLCPWSIPHAGPRAMPTYRIYKLTDGGHIDGPPAMLKFDEDQGAVRHAKTLKDGVDLEVWEGRRRVAVLKGDPCE
jgi:hypothetical protein